MIRAMYYTGGLMLNNSFITYVSKNIIALHYNYYKLLHYTLYYKGFCCALTGRKSFKNLVNVMYLIGIFSQRISYTGATLFYGSKYIVWNTIHSSVDKRLYAVNTFIGLDRGINNI
jgi:hypothetical protein